MRILTEIFLIWSASLVQTLLLQEGCALSHDFRIKEVSGLLINLDKAIYFHSLAFSELIVLQPRIISLQA